MVGNGEEREGVKNYEKRKVEFYNKTGRIAWGEEEARERERQEEKRNYSQFYCYGCKKNSGNTERCIETPNGFCNRKSELFQNFHSR